MNRSDFIHMSSYAAAFLPSQVNAASLSHELRMPAGDQRSHELIAIEPFSQ